MQKSALALLLMLALPGCAQFSEKTSKTASEEASESQCLSSDWEAIGNLDGEEGIPAAQLLKHQSACIEHGVIPDRKAYLTGWNQGVVVYCQPDQGFSLGQSGGSYTSICPDQLQQAFYAAFRKGRALYVAQTELSQLSREIDVREQTLLEVRAELLQFEPVEIADQAGIRPQQYLLSSKDELVEQQIQLEKEIQDLREKASTKAERLLSLRNILASNAL